MAKPPFTSEQIRAAFSHGHSRELVTQREGKVVDRRRTVYIDPDEHEVSIGITPLDDKGEPLGDAMEARTTWEDLRDSAVYPGDVTTITSETIDTPLGRLECARYEVASGEVTLMFWFSAKYPGPPIRSATVSDGREVESTVVTAVSDPKP